MLRLEIEIAVIGRQGGGQGSSGSLERQNAGISRRHPARRCQGVLQDIHWSGGLIGYFPTYALGNLISAQLWEKIDQDLPDLTEQIRAGKFEALLAWLREKIHRHGAKFEPQELVQKATGSKIDPAAYIRYLTKKYGEIYDL